MTVPAIDYTQRAKNLADTLSLTATSTDRAVVYALLAIAESLAGIERYLAAQVKP